MLLESDRTRSRQRRTDVTMDNSQKDILFLCQFFYPEYNSSATLPFDTAKYMASRGFAVDALVGYPREYTVDRHIPATEVVDGVRIRRIKYLQMNRKRMPGRLINYFSFTFGVLMNSACLKDYRAVVVYSNPPVLPIITDRAKKKYGTRYIFVAYDVYPEIAHASRSLFPGSLISRVMKWINRQLYRSADCVVALTDEMKAYLLDHRPELTPDRVVTIANWAHEEASGMSMPDRDSYARFGYSKGQFVVTYFGNLGICQDVDTMLDAAELLRDDDRIRFLIAGHGSKKDAVENRIREHDLQNVQLMGVLTGEDFEKAVAIGSCGIVSLEKGLTGMCAPSKYYTCLHGRQAVIAIVEKESYLAEEVVRERIGCAVEIGDSLRLRDMLVGMAGNPEECAAMGARAGKLYEEKYSYASAMEKYYSIITERCGLTNPCSR